MNASAPTSVENLLQKLVQIPSVNPEGKPGTKEENIGEKRLATWVGKFLEESCGASEIIFDEVLPNRPNLLGRFSSRKREGEEKPRLLFAPHSDTVSVRHMTIQPFGGELREGKIWGRGASDTKGTMAAMLWAFREMREEIPDLGVELAFVALMGEEAGQPGSKDFADRYGKCFDFAVVGEPTELKTVFAHKGCFWIDLITKGVSAHGATPERGENAIIRMMDLLDELLPYLHEKLRSFEDPDLGPATLNVGKIQGGHSTNIVPEECRVSLDFRETPQLSHAGGSLHLVETFLADTGLTERVKVEVTVDSVPLYTEPSHPGVVALLDIGSSLTTAPWFCDAGRLAEGGIPSVAIGPGSIEQAHTKDEFLSVKELKEGVEFYKKFIWKYSEIANSVR